MRKVLLLLGVLLIGGASGCNSSSTATATQAMQQAALAACNTYTASLAVVTQVQRTHPLSPAQIATVNEVRAQLNPLCSAGTPADGATATIMQGLTRLLGVQNAAQGG